MSLNLNIPSLQTLLSSVRRAVDDYDMIAEGDRIAVGVSGGKDSLALLCVLSALKKFYPIRFEIVPVHLRMGFPGEDSEPILELCEELGLKLVEVPTDIYEVVFGIRQEKSPCSLCANLRRGILYSTAKAAGCRKIALGHHFDDAVETLMMNLFVEGRFGCFAPVTFLSRMEVTMIRPMLYVKESDIRRYIRLAGIRPVPKLCPSDGFTKREETKQALAELERKDPGVKKRLFGALERSGVDGYAVHPRGRKKYTEENKEQT